ncbi:FAD-dependent oxidoreductase domain-containing protein 1 [Camponotus japonicus]
MPPTMPPDSHQISLKIIEAIKQHPVLYCTEVKGLSIKLQEFKQKVWKRISDELGLDPMWVRLKWKNLRDTYCRILKYKNKTEEGVRRKKWIFEDHLSFLKFPYEADYQPQCVELTKEYIQDINSGEISSEGLLEQLEDRNDEDYSEYLEIIDDTAADPVVVEPETIETLDNNDVQLDTQNIEVEQDMTQQDIDNCVQQIQSKYRKIRPKRMKVDYPPSTSEASNSYNVIKTSSFKTNNGSTVDTGRVFSPLFITTPLTPSTLTSPTKKSSSAKDNDPNFEQVYLAPESKSSIELFFDSMAQTVKKLPPKAQADIKMNICKIVTETEIQYSGQSKPQSTQQFVAPPGMIPKLVLIPCNMIDNQNVKE